MQQQKQQHTIAGAVPMMTGKSQGYWTNNDGDGVVGGDGTKIQAHTISPIKFAVE